MYSLTPLITTLFAIETALIVILFWLFYRGNREFKAAQKENALLHSHALKTAECLVVGQNSLKEASARIAGILNQQIIQGKVSQKMSERAFVLGNSANLACAILQKSLSVKRPQTMEQAIKNQAVLAQLAKENEEMIDWMEPTLNEEERGILDDIRRRANGKH